MTRLGRSVIEAGFSLDVPAITRRPAEIEELIAANPFAAYVAHRPHMIRVIILEAVQSRDRVDRLHEPCSRRADPAAATRHARAFDRRLLALAADERKPLALSAALGLVIAATRVGQGITLGYGLGTTLGALE